MEGESSKISNQQPFIPEGEGELDSYPPESDRQPVAKLKRGYTPFIAGPPEDTNNTVYICMLVIGVGVLLPWNAVITAVDFSQYTYSFVENDIETYISAAFTTPCVLVLLFMLKMGSKISLTLRMIISFVVCACGIAALPFVAVFIPCNSCDYNREYMNHSTAGGQEDIPSSCWMSLAVTIVLCFITGTSANVLQLSAFGFASILPPVYTQALMAGNGIAGVTILVLSFITSIIYECAAVNETAASNFTLCEVNLQNKRSSAIIYFALGGSILIVCLFLYLWIIRQPFTQYHLIMLLLLIYHRLQKSMQKHRNHLLQALQTQFCIAIIRLFWKM
jgi:MFS family permease